MIKNKFSTTFSLPIPILSLPGGPRAVPIVSDQNTVDWYFGPHLLVDRRAHELPQLQARRTVELLVLFTHILFSR